MPGFRKIASVGKRINEIHIYKGDGGEEFAVIHAENELFRFPIKNINALPTLLPIATLKDTRSASFQSGSDLYVLDGESIIRIKGDGSVAKIGDVGAEAYVPTTFVNGVEYEQRNLLSEYFKERYVISSSGDLASASEGLIYDVISPTDKTARITGISDSVAGAVTVPSYVSIGNERYKVTEISDYAFYGKTKINSVVLSDTVKRIGKRAFQNCNSLFTLITRDSIETLDDYALIGCSSLFKLYLGA